MKIIWEWKYNNSIHGLLRHAFFYEGGFFPMIADLVLHLLTEILVIGILLFDFDNFYEMSTAKAKNQ